MKVKGLTALVPSLTITLILSVSFLDAKLYPKQIAGYDRLSEKIMDAIVDGKKSMIQPNGCTTARDERGMPITFVTDPSAGRFEFFRYADGGNDKDTIQLSAFGFWGDGDGEYQSPNDVATLDGILLYILDTGNNRIGRALFNLSEYNVTAQSPIGTNIGLNNPMAFCVYQTPSGIKIYIADTKNHRILRLSSSGVLEATYGSYGSGIGQFNNPRAITRWGSYLYIADTYNKRIVVLRELPGGSYEWNKTYLIPELYSMVTSVDCDQNGNVYFIDQIRCTVTKFSEGLDELLWSVGSRGCLTNEYEFPRGISV